MILKLSRYYHTLKYLKPIQIYGQLRIRFYKPRIRFKPAPIERQRDGVFEAPIQKHSRLLSQDSVMCLNQTRDISASSIWQDASVDKLWLFNLHYFDLLHTSAPTHWQRDLMHRWINENNMGAKNSWESYTLSLRIVNWIKWILQGNHADTTILQSLATQARYLYKHFEIHLLANHLMANAKAMIYAGLFFSGAEAEAWLRRGLKVFEQQLKSQILADGGHFELSPMYHSIILEDLLDVINIFKVFKKDIPLSWQQYVTSMFDWLACMSHPDGNIAFFNDAAFGVASTLNELQQYSHRLQLTEKLTPLTHLKQSGFCRLEDRNAVLIADIGEIGAPYQPGHGHADTLSFELSINQQRLLVNAGTSTYAQNTERDRQRGTLAHNTLMLNGTNSSEVWKSFRVARRAHVLEAKLNENQLTASHDGYYHQYKVIHQRSWALKNNKLTITDTLSGKGYHKIQLAFHVHPQIMVSCEDDKIIFYNQSKVQIAKFYTDNPFKVVDSTYHPEFNVSVPNKMILVEFASLLPVTTHATIEWN